MASMNCFTQACALECREFQPSLRRRAPKLRRVSVCCSKKTLDPVEESEETDLRLQSSPTKQNEIGKRIAPLIRMFSGSSTANEEKSPGFFEELSRSFVHFASGTTPLLTETQKATFRKLIQRAETDSIKLGRTLAKTMVVLGVMGAMLHVPLHLSDGDPQLESWTWFSWISGIIIGIMIDANHRLESHAKPGPKNIVITGSTRGLGKALAREFVRAGDNVVVASRSPTAVASAVEELSQAAALEQDPAPLDWLEEKPKPFGKVVGTTCDVSNSEEVRALADFAIEKYGSIDIWINNAGVNKGFKAFTEFTDDDIHQIVSTNLVGSMICTREAIRVMQKQPKKGHIFNMDGAGSNGAGTALTAIYGASKCGLRQLHESLRKECRGSRVGLHRASPGMVLTELLLSGASLHNKRMFNIICEQPETVARDLVPKIRSVKGTGKLAEYLTPPRIVLAMLTAWFHRARWFDEEGRAVYAAEAERLRTWAEERQRTSFAEMFPSGAWLSLFSSSVICAYIILTTTQDNLPGT